MRLETISTEIGAFDAIAATNFSKGFVSTKYSWHIETLTIRGRSREFVIQGCAGVKWSIVVDKRAPSSRTAIGLYCKDAPTLIPIIFRITLYDGESKLLMNRSCYFTFCGGSSGCGFIIENWPTLEHTIRLQNQPLTAFLMVDVPRDRGFLAKPYSTALPERWTRLRRGQMETLRAQFQLIESGSEAPFTDATLLVSKSVVDDTAQSGAQKETNIGTTAPVAKDAIHCHRYVLCSHSPVFSRMLEKSDFRESSRREIDVSEDKDADRSTMIALLRYMYCGEVGQSYDKFKVDLDDIVRLLNVAEKYQVENLKLWCQSCMIVGYDTEEQRRRQLVLADMFDLKQLKAVCVAQLSSDLEVFNEQPYETIGVNKALIDEIVQLKSRKNGGLQISLK